MRIINGYLYVPLAGLVETPSRVTVPPKLSAKSAVNPEVWSVAKKVVENGQNHQLKKDALRKHPFQILLIHI